MVELIGDYEFPVSPTVLWDALQDPALLARVLPGCQQLEKIGENEFRGNIKIAVGPVQGAFQGTIIYSDMRPPESLKLAVSTRGPSGVVNGEGTLTLTASAVGTLLYYQGEAQVGGRIASVSQRLIESSAKAVTKQSLQSLETQVAYQAEPQATEGVETAVSTSSAQATSTPEAPPAPSQTEFMMGVTRELMEEYIPNPQHRQLLMGTAVILTLFALLEWFSSRVAKKTAKLLQEKKMI